MNNFQLLNDNRVELENYMYKTIIKKIHYLKDADLLNYEDALEHVQMIIGLLD